MLKKLSAKRETKNYYYSYFDVLKLIIMEENLLIFYIFVKREKALMGGQARALHIVEAISALKIFFFLANIYKKIPIEYVTRLIMKDRHKSYK